MIRSAATMFRISRMMFEVASVTAVIFGAVLFVSPLHAESYPSRVIRIIVPYPAGGTSELIARVLAKKMGDDMGQSIVIENFGGASGAIGAGRAANAAPDGYTLLFGYATQFTILPAISHSLQYDPLKSFVPVGAVARFHFLITANSQMPFKTLAELVSYAKAHPGELTYASPGVGTSTQMIGELLKLKQGINILHVPYRGGAPAIIDYVAGRISVYWDAVDPLLPWVKKGTITPLAVTSAQRLPALPDVPTVIEAGMPDLNVFTWTGLFAPAGTPNEIVSKLQSELNKALQDKELQELFESNYYEMFPQSPAQVTDLIRADLAKWKAVADAAGIKLD
jgi:tripartite-type tricarboxylate transporter receptor subunit TctC